MRKLRRVLAGIAVGIATFAAGAGPLASRAELDAILGRDEVLETFEGKRALPAGQLVHDEGILTFENNQWITRLGVHYSAIRFYLNDDGFYGLTSRTLGDSATGRPISIDYIFPTVAMGVDLQGYSGTCSSATVRVYRPSGEVLATVAVTAPQFFGWADSGGISHVTFGAAEGCYLMLDNHAFGTPNPAVPTLSGGGIAALALALLAWGLARRPGVNCTRSRAR